MVSTWMGDRLGTPCAVGIFFFTMFPLFLISFSFLIPGNWLYSNYRADCSPVVHILTHINSDRAFPSILILSPYPRIGIPWGPFLSGFPTTTCMHLLSPTNVPHFREKGGKNNSVGSPAFPSRGTLQSTLCFPGCPLRCEINQQKDRRTRVLRCRPPR